MSLGPIPSPHDMLMVHLHTLSTEMWAHVSNANSYALLARQGCLHLPEANKCNFTAISEKALVLQGLIGHLQTHSPRSGDQTLWDLVRWEMIRGDSIYNSEKINPSARLSKSNKVEIQFILTKALQFLGDEVQGLSLVQVETTYLRYSGQRGHEYVLDLVMEDEKEVMKTWRCYLLFSPTSGMVFVETFDTQAVDQRVVEFIVPLSNVNNRVKEFLQVYEDLCLKTEEACSLTLVVYGKKDADLTDNYLKWLGQTYPDAKLNLTRGIGTFSRGRALELGMNRLPNSSLVFLCDVDMVIEHDFLKNCRRNTIEGEQVYYPEFFKYYNMDYVYRFNRKDKGIPMINRKHGHWAYYSYGMLCLHKSDYISVGGFDLSIEGWGGEDKALAEAILRGNLEIMRAPDPSLLHRYHDKVCSVHLTAEQFTNCISSRSEDIADRNQLADYVFYLEDKCQIKHWNLWTS